MKIALIGLGTVGQAFYELLDYKGLKSSVKYVVIKDPQKKRSLPADLLSLDWQGPLNDPEIDQVVELIDDAEVALEIARKTLQSGKNLISANKKMLAENLPELLKLCDLYGGRLSFEASVAGAIPIIRTIQDYFEPGEVEAIQAILNGSTNFILEEVAQGLDYAQALEKAQNLGFAESDPYLDVSGWDASYKLSILIYLLSGEYIAPSKVNRSGLEELDPNRAIGADKKAKLLASWEALSQSRTKVGLEYLKAQHPLYAVPQEENAILVHTKHGGSYLLQGKGAGAQPTAWAVYADLKSSFRPSSVAV